MLILKQLILHIQHRHTVCELHLHDERMPVGIIQGIADDFIVGPGMISHISLPRLIPHKAVVARAEQSALRLRLKNRAVCLVPNGNIHQIRIGLGP